MSWKFTIQFLDDVDSVLATENIVIKGENWRSPLKAEIAQAEAKNIAIDWKKLSIVIEKI